MKWYVYQEILVCFDWLNIWSSKKKLLNDDKLMAKLCDTIQKTDINWWDLITHQDHIKEVLV